MRIYRDEDADPGLIIKRRVAMLGFGNQGRAHAENLRDSGVREIVVALRPASASAVAARGAGFEVVDNRSAAGWADLVMIAAPDEHHAAIYATDLADTLLPGAAIGFIHGLAVHFGLIVPRPDLDVVMIAPKGPGHQLRTRYQAGGGLPALVAVAQDASGEALPLALSYAAALGCGRAGMIETSFAHECETDLFGEQAVLCGGIPALILAGYETLVEAGYPPELAYFECVHESKLIVDLIHARGFDGMRAAISTTAEYGGYRAGARIVTDDTRAAMRALLAEIRSGDFARALAADAEAGAPGFAAMRRRHAGHAVEPVAADLRPLTAVGEPPAR